MGDAKNIIVKPISSRDANKIIKALHYSGKVVNNSQLAHRMKVQDKCSGLSKEVLRRNNGKNSTMEEYARRYGGEVAEGYMLRYIYFLDPTAKERLTVPILPFSEIEKRGAGMYKGIKRQKQAMTGDQPEQRRCDTDPDAPIMVK